MTLSFSGELAQRALQGVSSFIQGNGVQSDPLYEKVTGFLKLIYGESKRLWFQAYDYEAVARTNPDAEFLGWTNALNGMGMWSEKLG